MQSKKKSKTIVQSNKQISRDKSKDQIPQKQHEDVEMKDQSKVKNKLKIPDQNLKGKKQKQKKAIKPTEITHNRRDPQKSPANCPNQEEEKKKPNEERSGNQSKKRGGSVSSSSVSKPTILENLIQKEDLTQNSSKRIKFAGFKKESTENQLCHGCYQVIKYPEPNEEDEIMSFDSMDESSRNKLDQTYLYELVYCQSCNVAVHWNCLGEKVPILEFQKDNDVYLLFKCDKCIYREEKKQNPRCVACGQEGGFMKFLNQRNSEEQNSRLAHLICSVSLPQNFCLQHPNLLNFRLIHEDIPAQQKEEDKKLVLQSVKKRTSQNPEYCFFCKGQGYLLQCNHKDEKNGQQCQKYAHPFCMQHKFADDIYRETEDDNQWQYFIYYNDKKLTPHIEMYCSEHKKCYLCSCKGADIQQDFVQCDFCKIWYHFACEQIPDDQINDYQSDNSIYTCRKCIQFKKHFNELLAPLILRQKDKDEFLDNVRGTLRFQSLVNKEGLALGCQSKIFEQILYAKAWIALQQIVIRYPSHIGIFKVLKESSSQILISLLLTHKHLEKFEQDALQKFEQFQLKDDEQIYPVQDLLDQNLKKLSNFQKLEEQNKKNIKLLDRFSKQHDGLKIITEESAKYIHTGKQAQVVQDLTSLVLNNPKPSSELMRPMLAKIVDLDLTHLHIYNKCKEIFDAEQEWKAKCVQKLKVKVNVNDEYEKIKSKVKQRGMKRIEKVTELLKKNYEQQLSTQGILELIEEGELLKSNVSKDIRLHQKYMQEAKEWDTNAKILQKKRDKPTRQMEDHLVFGALMPIRPDSFMPVLLKWNLSNKWHFQAKQFVENELNLMKIDDKKSLVQEYYWDIERAKKLQEEIDTGEGIYADVGLQEQVKAKIQRIEYLMKSTKMACQHEKETEKLEELKKELKKIRNVNFDREIECIKEKIQLLEKIDIKKIEESNIIEELDKELKANEALKGIDC